jgi:RNA-binding protein
MTMRGKDRAALRAEAHHLTATVHVGQHGLSDTLVQSLDEALAARELVKVQVSRNAPMDARTAAGALAERLGADVVQVIGRTTTLYRHNPDLERKPGAASPWREA